MEFDLVYCRDDLFSSALWSFPPSFQTYLAAWIIEQPLEMCDPKVANPDIPHLPRAHQLLHLSPRIHVIPIRIGLAHIVGIGAAGPMHQVEIHIVRAQGLERGLYALLHALVPWVIQLGGEPDFRAWDTAVLDAGADFGFVAVGEGGVDVAWRLSDVGPGEQELRRGERGAMKGAADGYEGDRRSYGSQNAGRPQRPSRLLWARIAMFQGRWRGSCRRCSK